MYKAGNEVEVYNIESGNGLLLQKTGVTKGLSLIEIFLSLSFLSSAGLGKIVNKSFPFTSQD